MESLIRADSWEGAWRVLALVVGPVFAVFALVLFRDAPEPCGLEPDGGPRRPDEGPRRGVLGLVQRAVASIPQHRRDHPAVDQTLPQARRTLTFWVFIGALVLFSLTGTAFTFHVVSIFEGAGFDRTTAVNIFLPISIIAMTVQFTASSLSDYFKLKYILVLNLAGQALMLVFLALLAHGGPIAGLIVAHAVNTGTFGILANITWARYFGRAHLGAISGFVMAFQVAGSAVGPYVFSLSLDLTGGYTFAALVSLAVAVVLFVLAFRVEQPGY